MAKTSQKKAREEKVRAKQAAKGKQAKQGEQAKKDEQGEEKKHHWAHGKGGTRSQVWTGSLSFGLVSVPVALVTAARDHSFRFRQLHAADLAPIEQRRFCSLEGVEVSWDEIGRGYELDDADGGGMVVFTDEELEAAAPERTRTIEIEAFVDLAQVDPIQMDRPYHLTLTGTSDGDRRAYRLLLEAMRASGRAAIGRMVMRSREYLVLVRPRGDILGLTTLHFHDEVRAIDEIPAGEGAEPHAEAVRTTVAIVEELSVEWRPESYKDHYRERIAELIRERRRTGRSAVAELKARTEGDRVRETAAKETESPDLMAALSRALDEARGRGPGKGGKSAPSGKSRRPSKAPAGRAKGKASAPESLEGLSREELYRRAQEIGLPGRSRMSKDELIRALKSR